MEGAASVKRIVFCIVLVGATYTTVIATGVASPRQEPSTNTRQNPSHPVSNENAQNDILLRDFKPRSMLKIPVHEIEQTAFPAVDVHNHINDARKNDHPIPLPKLLARMDRINVKRIVILTGGWGDKPRALSTGW
jgi:hypothetical protein